MNIEENTYSEQIIEWLNKTMTIELFLKIAIIYFIIIWISIIFWVIRDSSDRSNSIIFQIFSILLITIGTPLGIFIYLLIRPPRTLFEKYSDDIEFNLSKLNKLVKISEKIKQKEIKILKKKKSKK